MKIKRTFIAIITTLMMLCAFAPLFAAADETGASYVGDTGDTVPTPIVADSGAAPAVNNTAPVEQSAPAKSGMSFGGVFVMCLLTVAASGVLSFFIADRFYKMSKKDSHLQAEIRALRRDIDEKFSGNVTQVREKSATIRNSNRNYSADGGIRHKEEAPSEALNEIAKKWNIQIEEEKEPTVRIKPSGRSQSASKRSSGYKPKRETRPAGNIDADADVSEGVKDKAKKFLGDIFPFEED